jgi:hypothetical protein
VAISIFIKKPQKQKTVIVKYAEVYGTRTKKFKFLVYNSIDEISWIDSKPKSPNYIFKPINDDAVEYSSYFSLADDIFLERFSGVKTGNNEDTITFDRDEMRIRIDAFVKLSNEEGCKKFDKPQTRSGEGWSFDKAKLDVIKTGADDKNITEITYRPFDKRFTYFTGNSMGFHCRPRKMMSSLVNKDNLAIISVRQIAEENITMHL